MSRLRVGPYRLLGRLGQGAMGEVHRAEHDATGQIVALKTVALPREAYLASLRREIVALSRIRHPGVVRIVDHGVAEGLPWYAMELVEGVGLSALGTMAALRALRLACVPLAYLHGEGIVHRDLKPDNILVRADGLPVLVDFGLTTRFTAERGRDRLEMAQGPAGTLSYAAPELLRGEPVDARADLYALGCILHQIMTGSLPFTGSVPEVVRGHLERPPEAPARSITVPLELEMLIVRLLAKLPRERAAHAGEVAEVLALVVPDARWPSPPAAKSFLYRPGFAGRATLLAEIDALLAETGACLLGGESGLGKTRLAIELARLAETCGMRVLTGECVGAVGAKSGVPLEAMRGPLLSLADRCQEYGPEETARLFGERVLTLSAIEPSLRELPGGEATGPQSYGPERLFADLVATFGVLAEDAPLLLVIDDLQWADELTLAFLAHILARRPPGVRILGLYRSDEAGAALAQLAAPRRSIERLDDEAVALIARDMLALPEAPPTLSRLLSQVAEGNPLFVAEYLRAAVGQGMLVREGGRWTLASAGELSMGLPRSLRELIDQRLDALSAPAREVVSVAALVGRDIDAPLLAALLPGRELETALAELTARELLDERPRLSFGHDKFREVAYERLPLEHRHALHRAAAGLLLARPTRLDWAHAALHHQLAGDAEAATRAYLRAGDAADLSGSLPEALEYFTHALTLARQLPPEQHALRLEALIPRGRFLVDTGRFEQALTEGREAVALAAALGLVRFEIRALIELSYATFMAQADGATALALAERAAVLAESLGDRRTTALVENALGIACTAATLRSRAIRHYERARALAEEVGDLGLASKAVTNLGAELVQIGRYDEARVWLERSLELKRALGHHGLLGSTWVNLGLAHLGLGEPRRARDAFELGIEVAQRMNRYNVVDDGLVGLGEAALALGDFEAAAGLGARVLARSERVVARGAALRLIGKAAAARGDDAEAGRRFLEALAIGRAVGERDELADTLLAYGRFLRARGDRGGEALIGEAQRLYRELGFAARLAEAF